MRFFIGIYWRNYVSILMMMNTKLDIKMVLKGKVSQIQLNDSAGLVLLIMRNYWMMRLTRMGLPPLLLKP